MIHGLYRERVGSALRALAIHRDASYSWFGNLRRTLPLPLRRALPPETLRDHLVDTLQATLYADFYCAGFPVPERPDLEMAPRAASNLAFGDLLSAANRGKGYADEGWAVRAVASRGVTVEKAGLRLALPGPFPVSAGDDSPSTANRVRVQIPKESRCLLPGFLLVASDEPYASSPASTIVRFYWNLAPEGAGLAVRLITTALNRAQLPFRLKIVDDPTRFTRCDALTLYTRRYDYASVRRLLEPIHARLARHLKAGTPVFAKPIAPGLGLAEDPLQGKSFGMHRCRIMADGVVRAHEEGRRALSDRLATVEACFAQNGIRLETPYLNAESADIYEFRSRGRSRPRAGNGGRADPAAFLDTAFEIGCRLSRSAVWHEGRCNWMGIALRGQLDGRDGSPHLAYQALGPEPYGGTSGIALFLAELHGAAPDSTLRKTALGAISQSVAATLALPAPKWLSLYGGALGVALVAAYVGRLLREERLLEAAARLVDAARQHEDGEDCPDQVSGSAGAVLALLILRDLLTDSSLVDFACRVGDGLLRTATRRARCCSWRSPEFPKQQHLVGFAHGTAGIAYALNALYRDTADTRYRESAELAFGYERRWYNERVQNWPDLRGVGTRVEARKYPLAYPALWCHGAAGIALSRLQAWEVLGDDGYRDEALTALRTTLTGTEQMLRMDAANFSLCHGVAGNATVLLEGDRLLGPDFAGGRELAMRVAGVGIERYARRGDPWPLGVAGDQSPGLMAGLGGVGYFYLRLHDPALPSPLSFEPERLRARFERANHR